MTSVEVERVERGVCIGLLRNLVKAKSGKCLREILHVEGGASQCVVVAEWFKRCNVDLRRVSAKMMLSESFITRIPRIDAPAG